MCSSQRSHRKIGQREDYMCKGSWIITSPRSRGNQRETRSLRKAKGSTDRTDSLRIFGRIWTHACRVPRTNRKICWIWRRILQNAQRCPEEGKELARWRKKRTVRNGRINPGANWETLWQGHGRSWCQMRKNDQISLCLKNKNQNIKVKSNLKQN